MAQSSPEQVKSFLKEIEREFLPYQLRYIRDERRGNQSKFVLVSKAVRTGITYCHSYKASKKRVFRDPNAKPINELFASKNRDVATEYMRYHRRWGEMWNILVPGLIDFSRWTTERACYPGGDILIFSSDPDAFRGMEGDVTLDEVAFHQRQPELYAAAQSRIQWLPDGQVSLISSHADPETEFARWEAQAKGGKSHFSLHAVDIYAAVKQGLAAKVPGSHQSKPTPAERDAAFVKSIRETCNSEEDFLREYCCQPAALSSAVRGIDYDACVLGAVPESLSPTHTYGPLYVGMDCGFVHDLSCLWVLEQSPRPDAGGQYCYRTACVKVMRRMKFEDQFNAVQPILSHPMVTKGYIDQGAMGWPLAQRAKGFTGSLVQPFGFSAPKKGVMANLVRGFSQSHRISFPPDPSVRAGVLCVRGERLPGGGVKWDGRTDASHGDEFWGLALALYAAEEKRLHMTIAQPGSSAA